MAVKTNLARAWQSTRTTVARRLFLERQARFWTERLDGRWAADEVRARVVDVVAETHDVVSFLVRPDRRWQGHRAGQHVTVEVEVDGVRLRRCYSLSSAPGEKLLRLTVKRARDGRVSRWLHEHVGPGDFLRLGPAMGEFVLPDPLPPKLLFVTGGSGITPAMSMLRALDARDAVGDVVFVHYARSRADLIFAAELEALARKHRPLRVIVRYDDADRGFDEARLAADVPDFAARDTWLCGPAGLMARVDRMWADAAAAARLRHERFVAPTIAAPATAAAMRDGHAATRTHTVQLSRSGRQCDVGDGGTLLEELERAGERPQHGCRIGICKTCVCTKRTGAVRNLVTGEVSSAPDEPIQLCISQPLSDLELAL